MFAYFINQNHDAIINCYNTVQSIYVDEMAGNHVIVLELKTNNPDKKDTRILGTYSKENADKIMSTLIDYCTRGRYKISFTMPLDKEDHVDTVCNSIRNMLRNQYENPFKPIMEGAENMYNSAYDWLAKQNQKNGIGTYYNKCNYDPETIAKNEAIRKEMLKDPISPE